MSALDSLGLSLGYGPKSVGNIFRIKFTNLIIHDFGKSGHSLLEKLEVMHDNSCSCEVFILSWTQLTAEGRRPHVDLGSLSQCKASIPGQMRHINYGPAKPKVTEVFNPKCPSHKSIQIIILGHQIDSIGAEHVASLLVSSTLLSQPCEPGVVSKAFGTFRHSKINQSNSLTPSPVPG